MLCSDVRKKPQSFFLKICKCSALPVPLKMVFTLRQPSATKGSISWAFDTVLPSSAPTNALLPPPCQPTPSMLRDKQKVASHQSLLQKRPTPRHQYLPGSAYPSFVSPPTSITSVWRKLSVAYSAPTGAVCPSLPPFPPLCHLPLRTSTSLRVSRTTTMKMSYEIPPCREELCVVAA